MQQSSYLESKVLTAPPHRLHLMLIDGAIRFARQADEALKRGEPAAAAGPLMRVVDIVGEMLASVRESKTQLSGKLADLYLFLFRRVSEATINSDAAALAEALRLLEYERQTWQLACEKADSASASAGPPAPHSHALDANHARGGRAGISWQA